MTQYWGILSIIFSLSFLSNALAANRKVYFSQNGKNFTTTATGTLTALNSTCILTITNPSTASQTFTITPSISTAGTVGTTSTPKTISCSGVSPGSTAAACYTNTILATTDSKQVITWTFADYPATTITDQTVSCAGVIDVWDTSATSPGFVFANATLLTFIESGAAKSTVGGGKINGGTVFSQTPIFIGEGRPF